MRSSDDVKKLILGIAENDARIRAVLLTGSRANNKIIADKYQDFDVIFIVTDQLSFISDHGWVNIFGEKLIWQLPDEMILNNDETENTFGFHYLMLFRDGNRIDLTLFPIDKMKDQFHHEESSITWLDKDKLFPAEYEANDTHYLIKKPTEKQFLDVCNEFWWVSTYVAKGLIRNEITYSKEMLERFVRPMFMKIIEWHVGDKTEFSVSFDKGGRFMKNFLPDTIYDRVLQTYSDQHPENNWKALFIMMELCSELASSVADALGFHYNADEEKNVSKYIKQLYTERNQD
jgi:aminoglycoside 6-adenylyltransferase